MNLSNDCVLSDVFIAFCVLLRFICMLLPWLYSIIQLSPIVEIDCPKDEVPFYTFVINNNVLLCYICIVHLFTTFDPSSYTS